jgi:hypothetical protein
MIAYRCNLGIAIKPRPLRPPAPAAREPAIGPSTAGPSTKGLPPRCRWEGRRGTWSEEEIQAVLADPKGGRPLARRLNRHPSSLKGLVERLRLEGRLP